ncbi:hypothetical protein [uncultured Mediterranean phage uvMED]|nr:hypothetical protein [uncultured Mediterranean phage uvMED]
MKLNFLSYILRDGPLSWENFDLNLKIYAAQFEKIESEIKRLLDEEYFIENPITETESTQLFIDNENCNQKFYVDNVEFLLIQVAPRATFTSATFRVILKENNGNRLNILLKNRFGASYTFLFGDLDNIIADEEAVIHLLNDTEAYIQRTRYTPLPPSFNEIVTALNPSIIIDYQLGDNLNRGTTKANNLQFDPDVNMIYESAYSRITSNTRINREIAPSPDLSSQDLFYNEDNDLDFTYIQIIATKSNMDSSRKQWFSIEQRYAMGEELGNDIDNEISTFRSMKGAFYKNWENRELYYLEKNTVYLYITVGDKSQTRPAPGDVGVLYPGYIAKITDTELTECEIYGISPTRNGSIRLLQNKWGNVETPRNSFMALSRGGIDEEKAQEIFKAFKERRWLPED